MSKINNHITGFYIDGLRIVFREYVQVRDALLLEENNGLDYRFSTIESRLATVLAQEFPGIDELSEMIDMLEEVIEQIGWERTLLLEKIPAFVAMDPISMDRSELVSMLYLLKSVRWLPLGNARVKVGRMLDIHDDPMLAYPELALDYLEWDLPLRWRFGANIEPEYNTRNTMWKCYGGSRAHTHRPDRDRRHQWRREWRKINRRNNF